MRNAPDVRLPQWRYLAPDGQERLAIRSGPGLDAPTTGGSLGSGEVFTVVEERPNNGVLFLKLASGGWELPAFPLTVPLIEDEDGIKAHKVRRRGKEVRTVTKAKKRRRTAMVDPYMTDAEAGNVIEVDSDDARPERSAAKQAAKEQLRLQLERKQHEVQALRARLSQLDTPREERQSLPARQVLLGRSAAEAAHEQILDEKRRELQAMLARKRALSGVGVQKPPRYVD
ncbi:unnamed protein product [Effrenium voratum]|nr:unnamed protein product [Effrenium voratum]